LLKQNQIKSVIVVNVYKIVIKQATYHTDIAAHNQINTIWWWNFLDEISEK